VGRLAGNDDIWAHAAERHPHPLIECHRVAVTGHQPVSQPTRGVVFDLVVLGLAAGLGNQSAVLELIPLILDPRVSPKESSAV
jgi:hypothetical protein